MPRRRPPMETFSFRASTDVMAAARSTATKRDEYLGDAMRDFVTRYARDEIRAARTATPTDTEEPQP
jgi:hypothetical protein